MHSVCAEGESEIMNAPRTYVVRKVFTEDGYEMAMIEQNRDSAEFIELVIEGNNATMTKRMAAELGAALIAASED
jgi:hypothetical protein